MDAPAFQTLQHLCRSSEVAEEVRNLGVYIKSLRYKIVIDRLNHTLLGPRSGEGQPGYTPAQLVPEVQLVQSLKIRRVGARVSHRRGRGPTITEAWSLKFCRTCLSTLTWTIRWPKSFVFGFHFWIPILCGINMVS